MSVYDRRRHRETHAEDAPWSARPAIRPDPHPLYDDSVLMWLNIPMTMLGVVAVVYFVAQVVRAAISGAL